MAGCVVTLKERGESVVVDVGGGAQVVVRVAQVQGKKVKLLVEAPREWGIRREVLAPPEGKPPAQEGESSK